MSLNSPDCRVTIAGKLVEVPRDGELQARIQVVLKSLRLKGIEFQIESDDDLQYPEREFRKHLRSRGCEFISLGKPDIPEIDKGKCLTMMSEDDYQKFTDCLLPFLLSYLKSPIVVDGFIDHISRAAWKKTLPEPEHKYLRRVNKLAGNPLTSIPGYFGLLSQSMRSQTDKDRLDKISNELIEKVRNKASIISIPRTNEIGETVFINIQTCNYDDLELHQKIVISRGIEAAIIEVLKMFATETE